MNTDEFDLNDKETYYKLINQHIDEILRDASVEQRHFYILGGGGISIVLSDLIDQYGSGCVDFTNLDKQLALWSIFSHVCKSDM